MVRLIFNIAATALAVATSASAAATGGDFNILTFNVAGLPAIFNGNEVPGDKTTNAKTIGSLFTQYDYDVINVQEDFNYHASIYETDKHPYRTATSGGVPFGSGLNTLSNFPWVDFVRVKWATCSDASGSDCLTPKGFTLLRSQVSDGVVVDVYNLHADAGTEAADITARAANLKQVSDYIKTWSAGNAVIVFGDTNSRYTRLTDGTTVFKDQNGMKDAWVELVKGGVIPTVGSVCTNPAANNDCEIVDKVHYRGSKQLDLTATYFNYEGKKFLQPDGSILSDHNPITVNFTWAVSNSFRQSNYMGGPHGNWFNDLDAIPVKAKTSVISLRGNNRLDAAGLTLTSGQVFTHGGTGGNAASLTLASNEYWTQATICQGVDGGQTSVFYLLATTSTGRTVSAGKTTSTCATFTAPSGWQIIGYNGRSESEVERLAVIYGPQ